MNTNKIVKTVALCVLLLSVLLLGNTVPRAEAGVLLKNDYHGALNTGLKHKFGKNFMRSTANDAPEQWFTQKLDHFDAQNTDTWKQLYFVNSTMYKPGGPVFFILGGEGPLTPTTVGGRFVINNYAKLFNGLIVALEHRFYGQSMPKSDLKTENLKYLSSQQALADAAVFRQFVVKEFSLPAKTKFIVVGGSYPGNMAAWARAKYPHLYDMAIGSSAPVLAVENFPEYMEVVAAALGPSCNSRVRQATDEIERLLEKNEGRVYLNSLFGLCHPIRTEDDKVTFLSTITEGMCETVQYNLDNNAMGSKMNITYMCSIIERESDPVLGMASFVRFWNRLFGIECTQSNYDSYLGVMRDVRPYTENKNAAGRAWMYQTCTEFGYYQSAEGRHQPFSEKITLQWFVKQCEQLFGFPNMRPNIDFTNAYYGERNLYATKLLLPNGSIDPWHALAIVDKTKYPDIHPFFMEGTAHCADLYAPSPNDMPVLTKTREQMLAKLTEWIKE